MHGARNNMKKIIGILVLLVVLAISVSPALANNINMVEIEKVISSQVSKEGSAIRKDIQGMKSSASKEVKGIVDSINMNLKLFLLGQFVTIVFGMSVAMLIKTGIERRRKAAIKALEEG